MLKFMVNDIDSAFLAGPGDSPDEREPSLLGRINLCNMSIMNGDDH